MWSGLEQGAGASNTQQNIAEKRPKKEQQMSEGYTPSLSCRGFVIPIGICIFFAANPAFYDGVKRDGFQIEMNIYAG